MNLSRSSTSAASVGFRNGGSSPRGAVFQHPGEVCSFCSRRSNQAKQTLVVDMSVFHLQMVNNSVGALPRATSQTRLSHIFYQTTEKRPNTTHGLGIFGTWRREPSALRDQRLVFRCVATSSEQTMLRARSKLSWPGPDLRNSCSFIWTEAHRRKFPHSERV